MPSSLTLNGHLLTKPNSIVDAFATFFESTYINFNINYFSENCNAPLLTALFISEDCVLKVLKKCKSKMTTGPDGIPSFLLKVFAALLSTTLSFPDIWKNAKICPVFKKGDKCVIEN